MTHRQIVAVAIIYNGTTYSLPRPHRHHHVIRTIGGIDGPHKEGFLDDAGNYLSRSEAYKLATSNGQFKRVINPTSYNGKELYSEDLW